MLSFLVVEKKEHELEQMRIDSEHYKSRLEAAQADSMKERKVSKVFLCNIVH